MDPDVALRIHLELGPWDEARPLSHRRSARVWRVLLQSGDVVALKIGDGYAGRLVEREAEVIDATGPVTGEVLAAGRLSPHRSWLATRWWEGCSLRRAFGGLRAADSLAARDQAAGAAADAAAALAALHEAGWAHGDIQGDHLIRTAAGTRLIDLAWAHNPDITSRFDYLTPYQGALVHLEAPEIAQRLLDGETATPTPAADVYALGAALQHCWSGRWPVNYEAAGVDPAPGDLVAKRRILATGRWRHAPPSTWPELGLLLTTAMAPPPDRPTAHDLAAHFTALLNDEPAI